MSKSNRKANRKPEYLFFAEDEKGYSVKVLLDTLSGIYKRAVLQVTSDGIFHRNRDDTKGILLNICLPAKYFSSYSCSGELIFSFGLDKLKKQLGDVKKKSSMKLFIRKDRPEKISFSMKTGNGCNEIYSIAIYPIEDNIIIQLPETIKKAKKEKSIYEKNPKNISAADFQKFKTMKNVSKSVIATIQDTRYINFNVDDGSVSDCSIEHGDLNDDEEYYTSEFDIKYFLMLSKIPNITKQISFFAPGVKGYPLKMSVMFGNGGSLDAYVLDKKTISSVNSQRSNA